MRSNEVNPVAIRTKEAMAQAFLRLIQTKAFEAITVTDLCREAGVARKSFYNHFDSMEQVVDFLVRGIFQEMEAMLNLEAMTVRELLFFAFRFVQEKQAQLLLFYQRGLLPFAHKSITCYITPDHILTKLDKAKMDESAYPYIAAQVSAVLIAVVETWIQGNFKESLNFLVDLTEAMLYLPGA